MKLKNLLLNSTVCKLPVKLISVRGKDSFALIQSLLTNNVDALWPARKDFPSSIYGMFLSLNGRVIFDTILYSSNESNEMNLYLECHISEINPMLAHLKKYRMRKKAEINLESSSVYGVIENSFSCDLSTILNDQRNDFTLSEDPRAPKEGLKRLVVFDHSDDSISSTIDTGASSVDLYTEKRYELGIAEGPGEIVRNKALPLNYNVDLMNGVSFSKGCYLGQELTARTHHTGVIRRRVFPVELSKPIPSPTTTSLSSTEGGDQIEQSEGSAAGGPSHLNLPIFTRGEGDGEGGVKMGNLVCSLGTKGLAMLRVDHEPDVPLQILSDTLLIPRRPFWNK